MGFFRNLISVLTGGSKPDPVVSPKAELPIGKDHSHRVNDWIEDQRKSTPKKKRQKPAARHPIDTIAFVYEDRDGNETERTVDVFSSDDEYFEGFCHSRLGTRTFKVRRIVGQVTSIDTGEVMKPNVWIRKIYSAPSNTHVIDGNERLAKINPAMSSGCGSDSIEAGSNGRRNQILFAGFDKDRRADLEETAEAIGFQVVKSVTKKLGFLCIGPDATADKIGQAFEVGAEIIEEDDLFKINLY